MATNNPDLAVKLLIVLLDGFRWDYVYRANLPGFDRLRHEGVHAEYNEPIFPSLTYPNVMAITTGLYAENHGILMNYMYDSQYDNYFDLPMNAASVDGTNWWNDIEPIWITSTKFGLRTLMYQWPGCNANVYGHKAPSCDPYTGAVGTAQLRSGMNDIIDKFETNQADLGFLYCELTDQVGHVLGPSELAERGSLQAIDDIIGEMIRKIKNKRLEEKVNVIIVSDHGMAQTGGNFSTKIEIGDIVDAEDVDMLLESGSLMGVYPKNETFEKVYAALKSVEGLHVWKQQEIPEELHFKHQKSRVPPILVVAKKGYCIIELTNNQKQRPYKTAPFGINFASIAQQGTHGFIASEVEDMRGIFLAWGANFRKNATIPGIRNVDIYNLAMKLIKLDALPNNGSTDVIYDALEESTSDCLKTTSTQTILITFAFVFTLLWSQSHN